MSSEYCNFGEERRPHSACPMFFGNVYNGPEDEESKLGSLPRKSYTRRLARAIALLGSSKNSPQQHVIETFVLIDGMSQGQFGQGPT
jgi:hypothetical protein